MLNEALVWIDTKALELFSLELRRPSIRDLKRRHVDIAP
jgi:hypothetical protein